MPAPAPVERILELLRVLATPDQSHDVNSLAARFGTSTRTIRRDIAQMRQFGIEIREEAGMNNHKVYCLDKQSLPPVRLTEQTAIDDSVIRFRMKLIAKTIRKYAPFS